MKRLLLLLLLLLSHFGLKAQQNRAYKPIYKLDSVCNDNINTAVINNIDWNVEIMDVKGLVSALFFVTPEAKITDISIHPSIGEAFDNAFKNAVLTIDQKVLQCAVDPNEMQQVLIAVKFH